MEQHAGEVIADRPEPPQRVVERERQADDRSEDVLPDHLERSGAVDEGGIAHDAAQVVVDEGMGQRVEIDEYGEVGGQRSQDQAPLRRRQHPGKSYDKRPPPNRLRLNGCRRCGCSR